MFVEVKIQCPCGARYKFDVEPLHGRMPAPVHCPVCGIEGTASANAILQQKPAPPPSPPPAAAPAEVEVIPPPPRLAPSTALAVPSRGIQAPAASTGRAAPMPREPLPAGRPALLIPGIAGALIAAAVGGSVWFALIAVTGFELGLIAWAVGATTGWAARTLAHGVSARLGWLAAICALAALVLASILNAWRLSGAAPLGTLLAQAFGGATALWLLLAAASAGRMASR